MKIIMSIFILFIFSCQPANVDGKRQTIITDLAPKAIGPYSQAIKKGNRIYVAGQIGIDPNIGKLTDGIEKQTYQTLNNIKAILESAKFKMSDVVQCQIFITDMNSYKKVNMIYTEYFNESKPARAVVEVSKIPANALIEIMVIAEK